MDEGGCGEFTTDSMARGHYVYQEVWTPITGEYLVCGETFRGCLINRENRESFPPRMIYLVRYIIPYKIP